MTGYTTREVAELLGLSVPQVRSYVQAGLLSPQRGPSGEFHFAFPDIALLRRAKELIDARIPPRRVRRALSSLRRQVPASVPLSSLSIDVVGSHILARDESTLWNPESGQVQMDFTARDSGPEIALDERRARLEQAWDELDAEEWYDIAVDLESMSPEDAIDAYRRAIEHDPAHADAYVNLGRLLHEQGRTDEAVQLYREALRRKPDHVTAAFNLGITLEDLGQLRDALAAYGQALSGDATFADAHFNLASLHERLGEKAAALRHMRAYRELIGDR